MEQQELAIKIRVKAIILFRLDNYTHHENKDEEE